MDLAQHHYENFPVGKFIAKNQRPHIHAIYAFARTADDFADEKEWEGERLLRLAEWRQKLLKAKEGQASDEIFKALARSIQERSLPVEWLDQLIQAFESDVVKSRHETWDSLLDYSMLSANPVGRLMLWVHGYKDQKLLSYSDDICTALQLTNFWQDVAVDAQKNRIYLPQDELTRFGLSEELILSQNYSPEFINMMSELSDKTRNLFERGKPLLKEVSGRLGFELHMIWHGGMRILEKLHACKYDVFNHRPVLVKCDWARMAWRSVLKK